MRDYIWYLDDLRKVPLNGYKVFSCFSCGGGSTMGYKSAGYDVIGNCEIDAKMNELYIKNHKPRHNYHMPIQRFNETSNLPQELFDLDILDGSPPCSTFSLSGLREEAWGEMKKFREGQAYQILDDLFIDYLNTVEKLMPKIVIAENVKGLILGNARGYINIVINRLKSIGYSVQIFLLNSASMGVPQKRERIFIVARRNDLNLPELTLSFRERPILYGDFKDIEYKPFRENSLTYKRWLKRSNKDNSIGDTVARTENGKVSCFNSSFVKDNRTPNTLTAGSSLVRFDVPGYISDRDMKIIQTFPLDYNFMKQSVNYVCGMSVPPLMMKKIAEQIKKQWLDFMAKNKTI